MIQGMPITIKIKTLSCNLYRDHCGLQCGHICQNFKVGGKKLVDLFSISIFAIEPIAIIVQAKYCTHYFELV